MLTSSSDSQVILSRVASIASEPLQSLDDDDEQNGGRLGEKRHNISINVAVLVFS